MSDDFNKTEKVSELKNKYVNMYKYQRKSIEDIKQITQKLFR